MRLAFLKDHTWGALRFEPEWGSDISKKQKSLVAKLADEAMAVEHGDTDSVSQALLVAGGSPHGARPKIMVSLSSDNKTALTGHNLAPNGYRQVIIKFAGRNEDPSTIVLEHCYNRAAKDYGIDIFPSQLLHINGQDALCFERFDRKEGQRQHVHSLSGMLHTTHRIANSDWKHVRDVLMRLKGGQEGLEEAFRRAVFNAVFCVRDDHGKNHAFLRRKDGTWIMTPAYDVAFSDGPGGCHTLMYHGHTGKNVTLHDLRTMAPSFRVEPDKVQHMIKKAQDLREEMMRTAKAELSPYVFSSVSARFKDIDASFKKVTPKKKKP